MTNKITAGSTVRVLDISTNRQSPTWRPRIGQLLKVASVSPAGTWIKIEGIERGANGGWIAGRFKLVHGAGMQPDEIKVGTYIISLQKDDGTLLPAAEPKKYSSDGQAKKIAELMAAKHGGKFLIFKAIGEYEMPVAKPTFRSL
jgi:hypothetical protein